MFVPSAIAHPDIVALIRQDEPWSPWLIINQPSVRAIKQAVL
jgi:hypothetical protein